MPSSRVTIVRSNTSGWRAIIVAMRCASSSREAFLGEHERDLGLGLARPLRDFVTLLVDLGIEDLALALAADVLAGRHREHAGEATGDARDDDWERLAGCARDRGDDREGRYQSVLESEDDLADLAEE